MGRNGHTHSYSFESAHARQWPAKGKWSAFYIIAALLVVLLMAGQLAGCDDQSPSPVGPSEPRPANIELSPLEGQVGEEYNGVLAVNHNQDLEKIEVTSPDSTWSYYPEGRNFSTPIVKNFTEDGVRKLDVKVYDNIDEVTKESFNLIVDEEQNNPPFVVVSYTSNLIDEANIRVRANDDNLVDKVIVDFGNGLEEFSVNRPSIDTTFTRNYGGNWGNFTVSATAFDDQGLSASSFVNFDMLGLSDIDLEWRTYLFEQPLDGAKFKMSHRSMDFDTTLVSQNGFISARDLPGGKYDVLMIANPDLQWSSRDGYEVSNISRIKLTEQFLPAEYAPSFYRNLGHTYILSGPKLMARVVGGEGNQGHSFPHLQWTLGVPQDDVEFILKLNNDLNTLIETADNTYDATGTGSGGYLLSELGRQTVHNNGGSMLIGPDPLETITYIHNWGDPNCPTNWNIGMGSCTDGLIPGIPLVGEWEVTKEYFDTYMEKLFSIFNHPKVGGNPYDIEIVKGWSEDITALRRSLVLSNKPFSYFGHSAIATESTNFSLANPYRMNRSRGNVGLISPGWFSNEEGFYSTITESDPIVWKSIRDLPGAKGGAPYPVVIDEVFYPKDELFHKFIHGFVPYSLVQYVEGQSHIGFNIQLTYDGD